MSKIYIEGGGDSKELQARCREGFRKLLARMEFDGRMPRLVACGGRTAAFDDFKVAHDSHPHEYIALLVDSEEIVIDVDKPWSHLASQAGWQQPDGAEDDQALLMITCMETWIACDPAAVKRRFGPKVELDKLPPTADLERRSRTAVFEALRRATKDCPAPFSKGALSFEVLAFVSPTALVALRGFMRVRRVLQNRL